MPADEQAGQHAVDDLVVPDDHAAQLLVNSLVTLSKLGRRFSIDSAIDMSRFKIRGLVRLLWPQKCTKRHKRIIQFDSKSEPLMDANHH